MTRQLKNAEITHVSYVDKAANQKKFFLTKSAETPNFEKEVKVITKADDPKQHVYGVVYEPDTPDSHDDSMTAEEIEKAAHKFMKDFRGIDEQHDFEAGAGELLESYIAPADIEVGEETILKGSWVIVTKATDEIWEKIEKGEYTGYSMGGTAEVETEKTAKLATSIKVNKQTSPVTSSTADASEEGEMQGFFHVMKNFFTGNKRENITKGEVKDQHAQRVKQNNFWAAWSVFQDVIRSWDWRTDTYVFEQDPEKVREALQDLNDILSEILLSDEEIDIEKTFGAPPKQVVAVQKAGRKMNAALYEKLEDALAALTEIKNEVTDTDNGSEDDEVSIKLEDIQKMLDEKLDPITQRLTQVEKGEGGDNPNPEGSKDDGADNPETAQTDILKQFGDLLDQKLEPIEKRLTTVEKARSGSNQVPGDPDTQVVETQKSYMRHFSN